MILGIHSLGHDTGLALIDNGKIVFAIETERLTRIKHDSDIRVAIEYFLRATPYSPKDISLIAFSTNVSSKVAKIENLDEIQKTIEGGVLHCETKCSLFGDEKPCLVVAHEVAHAAAAAHFAGWPDDLLIFVNEGRGTFSRNSLFSYQAKRFQLLDFDSLPWYGTGWGWSALAYSLGLGGGPSDAGKVMALGGYGEPTPAYTQAILGINSGIHLAPRSVQEEALNNLISSQNFTRSFTHSANMVYAFQDLFNRTVFQYVEKWLKRSASKNLALSGGCALNLPANTMLRNDLESSVCIPPCPNDSGQALGAALYASVVLRQKVPAPCSPWINGLEFGEAESVSTLKRNNIVPQPADEKRIASLLASGNVLAYMNGVSGIGPRSLGDRSILANPMKPNTRKRVSETIKKREWFRPLSPIMTIESFKRLFPDQPASPFMLFQYPLKEPILPEATHIDKTARIQTLEPGDNNGLRNILSHFEELTGLPALINTSLNSRGKAICYSPQHVFDDFGNQELDWVVFGNWMGKCK